MLYTKVRHLSEIADPEVQRGVALHSTLPPGSRGGFNGFGLSFLVPVKEG